MAPVYDTDLAEERFAHEEWKHYELWEKVEMRLKRQKWIWIGVTTAIFLVLSSIPVFVDQWPKWVSISAARQLGEEVNWLKTEAATAHKAYELIFTDARGLRYEVRSLESCGSAGGFKVVKEGRLIESSAGQYSLVDRRSATALSLPGLNHSFCYDPRGEAAGISHAAGFGIIPVKDLTSKRLDRLSLLYLRGPSAEISFE